MPQYNAPIRRDLITANADGSYTIKGGGRFWCRVKPDGSVLEKAPNMDGPAARTFILQAKISVAKMATEEKDSV